MQPTLDLHRLTVADAMHEGIVTCSPSDGLGDVAAAMAEHAIHCVVAIDDGPPGADDDRLWGVVSDGRPVGVLSTLDIARAISGADGISPASGTARWRPPTAAHPSLTAATPTSDGSGGSDSRTRLRETMPRR